MEIKSKEIPDTTLNRFLSEQGELTFCVSTDNTPYCASCFYAFVPQQTLLVIKSEDKTRHIREALINASVAGTIVERNRLPGIIKGIQFTGLFRAPEYGILNTVKQSYYLRYPFASVMKGELWVIEPLWIKMTDNTPLVGKKIVWERPL